jgi:hypothetical protein
MSTATSPSADTINPAPVKRGWPGLRYPGTVFGLRMARAVGWPRMRTSLRQDGFLTRSCPRVKPD